MDDVRLYDRALSADEIEQLATTLRYIEPHTEAKTSSDTTSLTISTPTTDEGDLLIAAVATDGGTTISPPFGWTEINQGANGSEVTLGAWYKIAGSSELTSHIFTWSGNRRAYGWMMRFTGHNSTNPINAPMPGNDSDSTPTCPAVTTNVANCIILRLGAFDGSDITVGSTGLSDHTDITMDKAQNILFEDHFNNFNNWTNQNWALVSNSARADRNSGNLTSDNINTSAYSSFTIEFRYRENVQNHNVWLQFYNGSSYNNIDDLINTSPDDTWYNYQIAVSNSQYCRSNFRIRFSANIVGSDKYLWLDDVKVSAGGVSGGAGYVKQSTAGSSGTSSFLLGSSNEARTLTIAIAPASVSDVDCGGGGGIAP